MNIFKKLRDKVLSFMSLFNKIKIKAVHEDDLPELLQSLGIYEKIQNGDIYCVECNCKITTDNLWGIKYKNSTFHVICSNPDCISKLV